MFCTKCGAEIIEGAKFCTRCGTPVVSIGTKAKTETAPAAPGPAVSPPQAAPAAAQVPTATPSVAEAPAAETPVAEAPAVETPPAEAPAAAPSPAQAPAAATPAAETPVAEKPTAAPSVPEMPAAEAPTAEAPAATAPLPETHAGSGPVAGKPDAKKFLVPGIIALAVIVVALLLFNLKGSRGGLGSPEKAFEAYLGGYSSGDFDLMLKAYPDFRITYSGGKESLKTAIAADYERDFGNADGYQFIYEATGHSLLSDADTQNIENDINATFGTDVDITDAARVDYNITAKNQAAGTEETRSFTGGYAVKYKGGWYYFNVF